MINIDDIKTYIDEKKELEKVLFYAYERFSEYDYSITIQKTSMFTKTLGMKAKQEVKAYTYHALNESVSQSSTSSNYISTFSRFYDDNEKITAYSSSKIDDLKNNKAKKTILTYDEYINTYGKLFKNKYYVKKEGTADLLNQEDKYSNNNEGILRYGISIYEINDHSYKSANIIKKGKNYLLTFILDPIVSHCFFTKQIKNTGHMTADPVFSNSEITFTLDSSFNLLSSESKDNYKVKFGLINLDISMNTINHYFTSKTDKFISNKKEVCVKIPSADETDFAGFKLVK